MKLWLVICSDTDGASIDSDCVFEFKHFADNKAEKLREAYKELTFSVVGIEVPEDQEAPVYEIASAIREHAEAMTAIADILKEFVTCACSVNAFGHQATHPTVIVKKGE